VLEASSEAVMALVVSMAAAVSFTLQGRNMHAPRSRCTPPRMCDKDATDDSARWKSVLTDLNAAPVFAITDQQGNMLQQRERDGQKLVVFYAAVDRAKDELAAAKEGTLEAELKLLPVGLGMAYDQVRQGKGLIVPGFREISAAQEMQVQAPEDAAAMLAGAGIESPIVQWKSEVVPLFGCFEMSRRRPDGSRFTPVFMSHADAQAAFDKARAANPEKTANFEIDVVELPKLLELAVAGTAKVPPRVVPPSESIQFIRELQQQQQ
jgi:hypothetical protein